MEDGSCRAFLAFYKQDGLVRDAVESMNRPAGVDFDGSIRRAVNDCMSTSSHSENVRIVHGAIKGRMLQPLLHVSEVEELPRPNIAINAPCAPWRIFAEPPCKVRGGSKSRPRSSDTKAIYGPPSGPRQTV